MRYSLTVTGSPLSPDEIRAAAEVHRELGPDYDKAVVESFLERLGSEIDARVDARVAQVAEARAVQPHGRSLSPAALALGSIALGIPITAIVATAGAHPVGFAGVLVVWLAIAIINVAYAVQSRSAGPRR
jgi:hypothetical protein